MSALFTAHINCMVKRVIFIRENGIIYKGNF